MRLYQFGYARTRDKIYPVPVTISSAVRQALESGYAVVALESAVITHGLPRNAALDAVGRQRAACEAAGTIPAVVGVFKGELRVGLTIDEFVELAEHSNSAKLSPWNLASTSVSGGHWGRTVSPSVIPSELAGIRVM